MERLVTVKDVAERYGVTTKTAGKYLRQMFHYENPLAAPRWAFDEWEENRERMPDWIGNRRKAEITKRNDTGRVIVPRKR
jgi:hypothetical protein